MKRYAIGIYALLTISPLQADPVSQSTSLSPNNTPHPMMQAFSGDSTSGAMNPVMYGAGGMNNNPPNVAIGTMPNGANVMLPNRPPNIQNMPNGAPGMMPQGGPPPGAFVNMPGQNVNMMPGNVPSGFNPSTVNAPGGGNIPMQVPMPGGGTQTVYVPSGAVGAVNNMINDAQAAGGAMPPSMPVPEGTVVGNTRIIDDGGSLKVIVNPGQIPQGGGPSGSMAEPIPAGAQQPGQQPAQNVIIIQPNATPEKPVAKPPLMGPPPARPTAPAAPGMNAS